MAGWQGSRRGLLGTAAGLVASAALAGVARAAGAALPVAWEQARLTQGGWARGRVAPGTVLSLDGHPLDVAPDGRFLVAFDRDCAPEVVLAGQRPGAPALSLPLVIAPRAWKIEHIDAAQKPAGLPDEEYLAIRKGELARIAAARAHVTGAAGWQQAMIWPAAGRISGHFGAQRVYRGVAGAYHSGTDIAGGMGATIVAPADGVVILAAAQPFTLEGHLLMLDHGMGLNSAMLHCSELLVSEGQAVRQGEPLARIGMTGRATGPHLHWSLKWQDARLDPELFVPPRA